MQDIRQLIQDVLANGKADSREMLLLREQLYANGKIGRKEADVLAEMHKRAQRTGPGFEQFFYQTIKDHILQDGGIDAEEVAWLRQMIFQDNKVDDLEKKFLNQLKGEARQVCPEFETLFAECMK